MHHYDFIIAGGGAAGLSLAYHLCRPEFENKSILIIDNERKTRNDRTWGFWKNEPFIFDELIYKTWDSIELFDYENTLQRPLNDYSYNMIRGIDFYNFVYRKINLFPNIKFHYNEVQFIEETLEGTIVYCSDNQFKGNLIFNSCFNVSKLNIPKAYHDLKQHFKGYIIKTPHPVFNSDVARLFDFRTLQLDAFRFLYVLPFAPDRALVEYTLFSPVILKQEDYESALRDYLNKILKIETFSIEDEEFGIIPMTDYPFEESNQKNIINIGTLGGQTKASTGYTFLRIQKNSAQIVHNLLNKRHPLAKIKASFRHRFYDKVLLNVLQREGAEAYKIFINLFKKNDIKLIFRFLDERTSLLEDLKIMTSVSSWNFVKAFFQELLKKK